MLTYITVDISNDQHKAGIKIDSTLSVSSISGVNSVDIKRKNGNSSIWQTIYQFDITSISDLDFHLIDILTKCGETYTYSIDIKNDDTIVQSQIFDPVTCDFEGMFIGNFNEYYVAQLNCQTSFKRNTQVAYVTTLAARVPYRVSNAQTNYTTGQSEGLFFDEYNNELLKDEYLVYTTRVIDFLSDNSDKLLKTNDGQMWWVSIDNVVSVPSNNNYRGYYPISFSWTEIGDIPIAGMVVDNG